MDLKIFKYDRVFTSQMLADTVEYVTDKFKQSNKVFTVASAYGQIIYVIENLANLIFYYIEDSVTEMSIRQASRVSSVYSIASMAGYNPSRAIAASGQIRITSKPQTDVEIAGNLVIIPNYSRVRCTNTNKSYIMEYTKDTIRIDTTGRVEFDITITQGYIESQTLESGTGYALTSYNIPITRAQFVDNKWIKVYVNDKLQPHYDNILTCPSGEPGCMIRTGTTTGIDIFFGNGIFGSYPEVGADVRVDYLVTDGYSGNIITENLGDINWVFEETGFDVNGNEVNLNDIFDISTVVAPNFGSNPEPVALTRLMLSRSNSRLMVDSDYELLFRRMQAFSIVRVGRDENNERIFNVLLVPDVKKIISGSINYFTIDESCFTLTPRKKNEILKYIKRMGVETVSTDIRIADPVVRKYVINVSLILFSGYDESEIRSEIVSKVSDYFINCERHDRIPRSDLIKIIEEIEGVDSVNVRFISMENEKHHTLNPKSKKLIGLDEMNDIIIRGNEIAVIRGGWRDRKGQWYDRTYREDQAPGAINISVKGFNKKLK